MVCPTCQANNHDDATHCSLCFEALKAGAKNINSPPVPSASPPAPQRVVFNARTPGDWRGRGKALYRVYAEGTDLFFIKLGDPTLGDLGKIVGSSLGVVGHMVSAMAGLNEAKKNFEADRGILQAFLTRDPENNFRLDASLILKSTMERAPFFHMLMHAGEGGGGAFGLWKVTLLEGREYVFQFESVEDRKKADECLPAILGAKLTVRG